MFCYRDLRLTDPVSQALLTHDATRRLRQQQLSTDAHTIFDAPSRAKRKRTWRSFPQPGDVGAGEG
jgi:hypothetical protein